MLYPVQGRRWLEVPGWVSVKYPLRMAQKLALSSLASVGPCTSPADSRVGTNVLCSMLVVLGSQHRLIYIFGLHFYFVVFILLLAPIFGAERGLWIIFNKSCYNKYCGSNLHPRSIDYYSLILFWIRRRFRISLTCSGPNCSLRGGIIETQKHCYSLSFSGTAWKVPGGFCDWCL